VSECSFKIEVYRLVHCLDLIAHLLPSRLLYFDYILKRTITLTIPGPDTHL